MKFIAIIFLLTSCATYDRLDKMAAGYMIAGTVADAYTTHQAIERGGKERLLSPLLGEKPDAATLATFAATKIAVMLLIGDHVSPKWRKIIFGISGTASVAAAIHNTGESGK